MALVEVPFGILQALSVLDSGLVGLGRSVGVDGAGTLHGRCRGRAGDSTSLAAGSFLLLGRDDGRGGLWGAKALRGLVVVHAAHVVVQVPSTGESISSDGSFASVPKAEVRVVSVAMQSVGFALMAEQARVGRKAQLGIHAGRDLAAVGLQVRIQIFAIGGLLAIIS